jgi:CRISPR/Cas system-associated endoribonuclease Cas2
MLDFSQFLISFEKHASTVHFWYNLSQLNVYYLTVVQNAIFSGEIEKASTCLQKIDLSYLRYGYDEFLLLFVYLFQHKLCQDKKEGEELWKRLLDHARYLNYPIFTEEYFKEYFI